MPQKRSHPLSRAEILDAALHIVDTEGVDALSMRRLARGLGVEAMTLYHHFPNKEAILEGVILLALHAEAPSGEIHGDWKIPVAAAVTGFRRVLVNHPNVLPVMVAHPPTSAQSAAPIEGPLRFLAATGFSDADSSELFQAVFALAFGHAMLSTNYPSLEFEGAPRVDFTEESFAHSLDVILVGYEPRRRSEAHDDGSGRE
jgi:AcrR family transcriptional regulator